MSRESVCSLRGCVERGGLSQRWKALRHPRLVDPNSLDSLGPWEYVSSSPRCRAPQFPQENRSRLRAKETTCDMCSLLSFASHCPSRCSPRPVNPLTRPRKAMFRKRIKAPTRQTKPESSLQIANPGRSPEPAVAQMAPTAEAWLAARGHKPQRLLRP